MCRLYGFRSNEPTKVECSLVHAQNALMRQSQSDALGRSHADGWGLASYHGETASSPLELTVERRQAAAYEDLHFSAAAERIYATTVVAHVRRATVGGPAEANTHPFRYGRFIFAHNGTVSDFAHLQEAMVDETDARLQALRRGTTDSEQTFLWLLSALAHDGIDIDALDERESPLPVERLADHLARAVRHIASSRQGTARPSKLNLLLTDGRLMVASRFGNSLYLLERDGVRDCEICGIPHVHHDEARAYRAVVVASEPITSEAWVPVPEAHTVSVDPDFSVRVRPIP